MHYILSLCGWDEYKPYWFEFDRNKKEFKEIVNECFNEAARQVLIERNDNYIGGHDLVPIAFKLMGTLYGLYPLTPVCELSIGGNIKYRKAGYEFEKTDVLSKKILEKIIKHNEKIHRSDTLRFKKGKGKT